MSEGSDYIKVIADIPGRDQATLDAVVKPAHEHKKLWVAHAARCTPYTMAQNAGVELVTHAPLDNPSATDSKAMFD